MIHQYRLDLTFVNRVHTFERGPMKVLRPVFTVLPVDKYALPMAQTSTRAAVWALEGRGLVFIKGYASPCYVLMLVLLKTELSYNGSRRAVVCAGGSRELR